MPKFVKGDILYFPQEDKSFHQMTYKTDVDKCIVLYSDDNYYYFDSSVLNSMIYEPKEHDQTTLTIPIAEIDENKREYTIGLKTLLKKI